MASEGKGRLLGKVAFISGIGRGIGRTAAQLFAAEGATVFGCDVDVTTAEETVSLVRDAGGTITCLAPVDLGQSEGARAWIDAGIAEHGRLDILYNNAGSARFGPIEAVTDEDWRFTLRNELDLVMWTTRAAWPHLAARGGSAVVNVGSISAIRGHVLMGQSAHSATKGALVALTVQHAAEGSPHRIRVNAVSPGPIETPALRGLIGDDAVEVPIPLGRPGRPEDVVRAALFLTSDDAEWITGVNLVVDGGFSVIQGAQTVAVAAR
ncbi:MAG: SDR family oxidoreductase [Actinobacteria bacterium]|nr:SDR family oxidoreductase [Actinomycetota bacterium]OJU80567.1 MAG: dehydrogenase [Solirubrobacterales bacterium 70-9]